MNILSTVTGFVEGIKWKVWLGAIAALLACLPVAYCVGRSDGKQVEREAQLKAQVKEERRARESDDEADRREDQNEREQQERDRSREEAIDNAPRDETDAANRALACERLRAAGIDTPAACRQS